MIKYTISDWTINYCPFDDQQLFTVQTNTAENKSFVMANSSLSYMASRRLQSWL